MAWEAGGMRSARRMRLAQLVLRQRVLPQDPLGGDDGEPAWLPRLLDPADDDTDVAGLSTPVGLDAVKARELRQRRAFDSGTG